MTDRPGIQVPERVSPLCVIGVNHRTCSDDLRQQIYVSDDEIPAMIDSLTGLGAREAMVVSTCDRVDVVLVAERALKSADVAAALGAPIDLPGEALSASLYRHEGDAAVGHLFRVAAGLDSQVIGEPQILGQLKAAHRLAKDRGGVASTLEPVLQAAYEVAKSVRTETRIGEGATTLASAAISRVQDLHGDLGDRSAVLVGAGELGVLISEMLMRGGLSSLQIVDRFGRRAQTTARALGTNKTSGLEGLGEALGQADIVIAALGEGRRLLDADVIEAVLRRRRREPMFLLDLSVPSEIDPAIHRLDDAYVFHLDDLEHITRETRSARQAEMEAATRLVEAAVEAHLRDTAGRDAGPDIVRLKSHILEQVRTALAEAGVEDVETVAHGIAGRLAHTPAVTLRRLAEAGRLDDTTRNLIASLYGASEEMPSRAKDASGDETYES